MSAMKLSLAALAVCTLALTAQDNPAGQLKHLSVPTATSVRPVSVAAMEIERPLPYSSIIHLKGGVEIRTPVCLRSGPGNAQWSCDGSVVLRADEADFHEDTGEIEAMGNVKVTRERSTDARLGR
jgi:lipopolysaccharide assembly outer membrane protein LptD (OstA)